MQIDPISTTYNHMISAHEVFTLIKASCRCITDGDSICFFNARKVIIQDITITAIVHFRPRNKANCIVRGNVKALKFALHMCSALYISENKSPRRNSFQLFTLRFINMPFLYKIGEIIIYCLLKIPFRQLRIIGFHICFAQPLVISTDFMGGRESIYGVTISI